MLVPAGSMWVLIGGWCRLQGFINAYISLGGGVTDKVTLAVPIDGREWAQSTCTYPSM